MCDKLKEGDAKYDSARNAVESTGCVQFHDALEVCLKENGKDWRKCQVHTKNLGECVRLAKQNSQNN